MRSTPPLLTRPPLLPLLLAAGGLCLAAGLTACESKERNAREEVFESDAGRGMNERLESYAEPPPEDGSPDAEDEAAAPVDDEPPAGEPTNP